METFDAEQDAHRVKECADEIVRTLTTHFPENAGYSYTVLVYLLVRITDTLDVDPEFVLRSIKESFEVNKLLRAEVPNEFVN